MPPGVLTSFFPLVVGIRRRKKKDLKRVVFFFLRNGKGKKKKKKKTRCVRLYAAVLY